MRMNFGVWLVVFVACVSNAAQNRAGCLLDNHRDMSAVLIPCVGDLMREVGDQARHVNNCVLRENNDAQFCAGGRTNCVGRLVNAFLDVSIRPIGQMLAKNYGQTGANLVRAYSAVSSDMVANNGQKAWQDTGEALYKASGSLGNDTKALLVETFRGVTGTLSSTGYVLSHPEQWENMAGTAVLSYYIYATCKAWRGDRCIESNKSCVTCGDVVNTACTATGSIAALMAEFMLGRMGTALAVNLHAIHGADTVSRTAYFLHETHLHLAITEGVLSVPRNVRDQPHAGGVQQNIIEYLDDNQNASHGNGSSSGSPKPSLVTVPQ